MIFLLYLESGTALEQQMHILQALSMYFVGLFILFGMALLCAPGVVGQYGWGMFYNSKGICAMKGTAVVMTCSYVHPRNYRILSVFWFTPKQKENWFDKDEPEDLLLDSDYAGRVVYIKTDYLKLTITDVRERDSGKYYCMVVSDKGNFSDSSGLALKVTVPEVKVDPYPWNLDVKSIKLNCSISCSFKTFKWYKNGQYFTQTYIPDNPVIEIQRNEDEGSYACAVAAQDGLLSSARCVFTEQCWGVTHAAMRVCALKGSSIDLSCTYTFPPNHTLNSSLWYIQWDKSANVKDLRLHEEYLGRVDYLGTKVRESIMRITDVKDSDTNEYRFSILTHEGGSFHSKPGVILNVTELEVKVSPDSVREGQRVTLTCSATCTLSNNPTYIWYKNRQPVSDKHTTRDNRLYLNSCSREDEGSYSCAVRGHEGRPSPEVPLRFAYYPKRTLVLISHFMKSVTLTCTSDVSPPVHTYTWYKLNGAETSQVGSGQNYSLTNISSESNAQYFCEAKNDVGARNSTAVSITGTNTKTYTAIIYGSIGTITVLAAVLVTGVLWMRKRTSCEPRGTNGLWKAVSNAQQ